MASKPPGTGSGSDKYPWSVVPQIGGDDGAPAAGGTGVDGANVQRVSLATDVPLPAGEFFLGQAGRPFASPSSVLTRPTPDVTAYSQNDLIASHATAGSVVVPSFTAVRLAGKAFWIRKAQLLTNKTSGMGTAQFRIELWSAAPTFTNGDNGAYAVATGAAGFLGAMDTTVMTQVADGAYCAAVPNTGDQMAGVLAGTLIFWTLREIDATGFTPAAAQTFTFIPQIDQN